jgi:hypothetical protein
MLTAAQARTGSRTRALRSPYASVASRERRLAAEIGRLDRVSEVCCESPAGPPRVVLNELQRDALEGNP